MDEKSAELERVRERQKREESVNESGSATDAAPGGMS